MLKGYPGGLYLPNVIEYEDISLLGTGSFEEPIPRRNEPRQRICLNGFRTDVPEGKLTADNERNNLERQHSTLWYSG